MDSMVSQGMGKVKAVKARLSGLVGVFQTLAEQHGEVSALLKRARASDERFTELWPQIRSELLSHERAELRAVYPVVRGHDAVRHIAEHHEGEAAELERIIAALDALPIGSDERRSLYDNLVDAVAQHAREEEDDLFPKIQEALGKDAVRALDTPFRAAKAQAI